jgi:37-kD nucleoid-associated bacterial protein
MVNFSESRLDALAIHRIGSKQSDEGVTLSKTLFPLDLHDITDPLQTYFVGSFKWQDVQQFAHRTDIALNEVYALAAKIFDAPTELLQHSVDIAKHLYEKSGHPKIKTGDFFVAFWYDVIYEDELCNAIGIFKAENRDVFLKTTSNDNGVDLLTEEGINIKTLDKGAVILDTGREEGFRVFVVDKASRNTEAQYWCDEFLQIERVHDNAFHTASYLDMMVDFCEDIVSKDTNRKEQVDFLNKSLDFFNKKETIDWNEFDAEVLASYEPENEAFDEDGAVQAESRAFRDEFDRYKSKFEVRNAIEPQDGFTVSKPAIAKAKRRFKTLIKMDTEIELKIKPISEDADNPFVERGYDEEKGMHYYTVYFNHES